MFKNLLIILILLSILTSGTETINGKKLIIGKIYKSSISIDEKHSYSIRLQNGEALLLEVSQIGIDLAIDVISPDGEKIKKFDSPNGANGIEKIDFTANKDGNFTFIIIPFDDNRKNGKYEITATKLISFPENLVRLTKKEIPSNILSDLWEKSLTNKSVIDSFLITNKNRHIIEPIEFDNKNMQVTYFCVPDKNTEYVMLSGGPDFLGMRFHSLGNTKLHFVTQIVPNDARFQYGFNYFNLQKFGTNNEIIQRSVDHVYDGIVEMPNAPKQNYILERDNVKKGSIEVKSIKSKFLSEKRKITIYTPFNYNNKTPHNLLIIFDGEAYGARPERKSRIPTPVIMDNLISENKIKPTIAVLVWSMGKRSKDLISDNFSNFIAKELILWIGNQYNISANPKNVVLAGSSRGGFAASNIALNNPQIIGNVLSQSGSYWITNSEKRNHWIYPEYQGKLIKLFKTSPKIPIKFYMDVGLYDAGASMLGFNRQLKDILEIKGYDVTYYEFKGGHSYINWRGTLAKGLITLLGN